MTPTQRERIIHALTEAADYFSNRADADGNPDGSYTANEEMTLQQACEAALECFSYDEVRTVLREQPDEYPYTPEYEYEDRYEEQFLPRRNGDSDVPF